MRNRYSGTCYRCGQFVPKGAGHFEFIQSRAFQDKKFRLQHAECAIEYRSERRKEILGVND